MSAPPSRLASENAVLRVLAQAAFHPPAVDPAFEPLAPVVYFLLDCSPADCVEDFTGITLGRLLQQLSRSTEQRPVEFHARVRGRVLWPATLKARYTEGVDPTRFVCSEVHHRYDTLENQLLKWLLLRLGECVRSVPAVIRQGICLLPEGEALSTAARLGKIEVALVNARRSLKLSEVSTPRAITEAHLQHAESAALSDYAQAARLFRKYRTMVSSPSWQTLASAGRRALPLPARPGPQGDPWLRIAAAVLYTYR